MTKLFLFSFFISFYFFGISQSKSFLLAKNAENYTSILNSKWSQYTNTKNFGFTSDDIWFKITNVNDKDILVIRNIYVSAQMYQLDKNLNLIDSSCFSITKNSVSEYPNFEIDNETEVVLLKISSNGMKYLPLLFHSREEFLASQNSKNITVFSVVSILLIISFFSLLSYFFFKKKAYIFYTSFLLFSIYNTLCISGLFYTFFLKKDVPDNMFYIVLSLILMEISFSNFGLYILNASKRIKIIVNLFLVFIVLTSVFSFFFFEKLNYILHNIVPIVILLFIGTIGLKKLLKGKEKYLSIYLGGWAFFFAGSTLTELMNLGVLMPNYFTENSCFISYTIESIFFTIAFFAKQKSELNDLLKTKPTINYYSEFELSVREKEVANLLLKGYSNQKIASELFISISTVKFHLTNIYDKCNVKNRTEALIKLKKLN